MTSRRRWIGPVFPALLFLTTALFGQQEDFQSWYEIEFAKELSDIVAVSLEIEQRTKFNSLEYDRTLFTITGESQVADYLDVACGVRGFLVQNKDGLLESRFRLHSDVTGSYSWSDIDFSFRTRIQYGFDDLIPREYFGGNSLTSRNRFKLDHHIYGTRFGAFTSAESWHRLLHGQERSFVKFRYSVGVNYMYNFRSEFTLRYMSEQEHNVKNPMQIHILVLGLGYSF